MLTHHASDVKGEATLRQADLRFTPETDQSDGEAMLAHLRRRNLFILPLDDEHHWYRYHHLFADLLGNLLRQEWPPERIQELHLRACEWHDRNGSTAEAVSHALAARDFERLAQLIERNSLAMANELLV